MKIKKKDTKIVSIMFDTALITILVYMSLMPLAKKWNNLKFYSKLVRKLYLKKNKKADDPL